MTPDELDRILGEEELLEPSSGFAMRVMAAVRREAEEPPRLRFPWWRFAAGVAGSAAMGAAAGTLLLGWAPEIQAMTAPLAPLAAVAPEVGYGLAAVLVGLGIAAMPRLLLGGRG